MANSSEITARVIRENTEARARKGSAELSERLGRYVSLTGSSTDTEGRGMITRAASTVADVRDNIGEGAWRGIEGIVDFAINVNTLPMTKVIDYITGADTRRAVRDFIEADWTEQVYNKQAELKEGVLGFDYREQSYQNNSWLGEQLKAIEQGVGGMLPAVAVSVATGGAGAPAATAQMASLVTTGLQAAGQGTQQAYRDGAGDLGGAAYGAVTGGAEVGVEKLTGGMSKWLFGAGVFDDILPILPRNIVTRALGTFAGEGLEEAVTEAANPLMKTTYQGAQALKSYTDPEERKNLIKDTATSFLQGGATALVFANTVGYGISKAGGGHTGREANVSELLEDIEGLSRKETNLRRAYKLTPEKEAELSEQTAARYRDIQRNLQAVDAERRARMIETFSLDKAFDADGNFTEDFRRRLGMEVESDETLEEKTKDSPNSGGSQSSKGESPIVSPRDGTVSNDSITQKGGTVKPSAKKLHPEFFKGDRERVSAALESAGLEAVTDMESLSREERASYRQFLSVAEKLDGLTGGRFDFVITEASKGETGAYSRRNDVIMISRETLQTPEATARALYDSWFGVTLEETMHMMANKVDAENANAYTELWHLLRRDKAAVEAVADKLIELGYLGEDRRAAKRELDYLIHKGGKEGAAMTADDVARYEMILDELLAHLGRDKLSTQHFFERMIREDKSAAERFLEAIRGLKNRLGKRKQGEGAVEAEIDLEALRLEGVFLEAVRECGGTVDDDGRIVGGNDEEEKTITEKGVRYSIIRHQYPRNRIQQNMEELADMGSVYQVESKKLEKSGRKPSEIYADYFEQWGNNIYTEEFGDIALKPSSVKSEVRHGTTSEKIATIEAIPAVLQQGKVIFSATKQGDVERIVIAAPIRIGEDGYYMGVMLQRDSQNQRLYLHNVVAEKETATSSVWSLTNRTDGSESDSLFMTSILQNALDVKRNMKNISEDVRRSKVAIGGKYYEPNDETLIDKHPTITATIIQNARYQKGERMSDAAYRAYRSSQTQKAEQKRGVYENKDTSYSGKYGKIVAEFGTAAIRKGKSHGGVAMLDILPYVGEIFENAVVVRTRADRDGDTNIRGIIELVGCATLNGADVAIVKLNVKEYANNEAKIYENRVIEIEELTVLAGVGQLNDKTSNAVSSAYIIRAYRDFVNRQDKNISEDDIRWEKKVAAAYERAQKRIDKERASMKEQLRTVRRQRDEKIAEAKQEKQEGIAKARRQRDEKIAEAKAEAREYVQKGTEKINEAAEVIHWRKKANAIMLGIQYWNTSELKAPSQIDNRKMLDALTDLNRVVYVGDISDKGTRNAMKIVLEWYRQDGVKERFLGVTKDENGKVTGMGYYSETIEGFIERLATGKGKLKLEELKSLCEVLGSLKKVIHEAHKVRVRGKLEDVMLVGREYEDVAKKSTVNFHARGLRSLIDKWMISYNDPMTLMRFLDSYADKGFATDMLQEFRRANTEYDYIKYGLEEVVRKFERAHKGYFDRMAKRTVKLNVNGHEYILPADEAMRIHEQLLTDDGLSHILWGGTEYRTIDGNIRYIDGFAQSIKALDEAERKNPYMVEAKYG